MALSIPPRWRSSFSARKLIYDDLLLNLKHRRRALRTKLKQSFKH